MRRSRAVLILSLSLAVVGLAILADADGPEAAAEARATAGTTPLRGGLPLRFEANVGQADSSVGFVARGAGTVLLRADEARLTVTRRGAASEDLDVTPSRAAVSMKLVGADARAEMQGREPLSCRTSYLKGKDPAGWITGVPTFSGVVCRAVYPGIDLSYHGCEGRLEYDFVLAPGADPEVIRIAFTGAENSEIDESGNLVLGVAGGEITHRAPELYQELDGNRRQIAGRFVALGDHEFGFAVEDYDPELALVVDPVIEYSTFLGGSGNDALTGIAVHDGYAYVAGHTDASDFPSTLGGPQGGNDVVVAKLSQDGSYLEYATYIGGSDSDTAMDIAVDGIGCAYVTGGTFSTDFPTTTGAWDESHNGGMDGFALILGPLGDALVYGTYLGGADTDVFRGIALGPQSPQPWIYLAGLSYSQNLATPGAFSTSNSGSADVVVAVLDPQGQPNDLQYLTYMGTAYTDWARDIAVDSEGYAYIVGESTNRKGYAQFPTTSNAYKSSLRIRKTIIFSAFFSRLSPDGAGAADLKYSTFFKNPDGLEWAYAVDIDENEIGRACITGMATNKWPTTDGAFDTSFNGNVDAYVTIVNTTLAGEASLEYSTFLGGGAQDNGYGIAFDTAGAVWVTGWSDADPGAPFPLSSDAFPTTPSGFDAFLTKLQPGGNGSADLLFSTLIGGAADDSGQDLALGVTGDVYLVGSSESLGFPVTPGAFDTAGDSNGDGFVMYISLAPPPPGPPAVPTNLVATAVSSSEIALSWTDNANDEDGFDIARSADGVNNWTPLTSVGPGVTSYSDTGLGPEATWYYYVLAYNGEGDSAWSNVDGATTFGTGGGTAVADGEIPVSGTVTGSYLDTQAAGGSEEAIKERESGGKPSKRYSYLEHKWTFTLPAGTNHTLFVEGSCTDEGDGDTFVFEFSANGQSYYPIIGAEITPGSGSVSGPLPGSPSGTIYIRVVDTDRGQGHRAKDTVSIDHLYIVSQ